MLQKIDLTSSIALKWTIIVAIFSVICICICFDLYFIANLSTALRNVIRDFSTTPFPP